MSHIVTLAPFSEVVAFHKNLIPAVIPAFYPLKPDFKGIADDDGVRSGVAAFRDFLLLLSDRLTTDGHMFARPPKKPTSVSDYPFLHHLTEFLGEIGYYGVLRSDGVLTLTQKPNKKIPLTAQYNCCGF